MPPARVTRRELPTPEEQFARPSGESVAYFLRGGRAEAAVVHFPGPCELAPMDWTIGAAPRRCGDDPFGESSSSS